MADLPNYAVVFNAQLVGSSTAAVGNVVIRSASVAGRYVVATAAERGTRRSEGVATTAYGGSGTGSIQYQQVGTIGATISGLAASGSQSLVRCSATGTIERIATGSVNPSTDDIIGYAEADGSVHLLFGLPLAEILTIAGGGGATPGGSNGQVQINAAGAFGGRTLVGAGGISTSIDATNITIDGSELAPDDASFVTLGTTAGLDNERVLTAGTGITITDGGAGSTVTVAAPGLAAQFVTLAATGDLANERVLTAGTNISFVDGGAGSTLTINASGGGGSSAGTASQIQATDGAGGFTAVTFGNQGAVLRQTSATAAAFGALDLADTDAVTGVLPLGNMAAPTGTGIPHVVSGAWSAATSLIVNADVNASAAIAVTKIAAGTAGQFLGNVGGTNTWGNTATFVGLGTTPATAGDVRVPTAGSIQGRNPPNSANLFWGQSDSSSRLWLGTDNAGGNGYSSLRLGSLTTEFVPGGSFIGDITSARMTLGVPIHGSSAPYAAHGRATRNSSGTLSASEYSRAIVEFNAHSGGTFTFPAPSSADYEYWKLIRNTDVSDSATVSIGSGTTANVGAATSGTYHFRTDGVFKVG